jgi:hypothetical protein
MPTKRLTDQFVERVPPPSRGRVEYFDAAFPALSLGVSEHGPKSWSIFYRVSGNPRLRRYKLGIYPHIKPAQARLLAIEVLDQVRSGTDPGALRTQPRLSSSPDIGSIDALVGDYLRQLTMHLLQRTSVQPRQPSTVARLVHPARTPRIPSFVLAASDQGGWRA